MLGKTVFAMALGAAAMLAGPAAQACVWTFGVPAVNAAIGVTATPAADCGAFSTLTLTAFGIGGAQPPTPPQLFSKNLGPSEIGIGLTNDPNPGENEINVGNGFVQLSLAGVTGSHAALSISFNSVQAGEGWEVLGSNTAGVVGPSLLTGSDQAIHIINATGFAFLDVRATAGNILLANVSVIPPGPEAGPHAGAGLQSA